MFCDATPVLRMTRARFYGAGFQDSVPSSDSHDQLLQQKPQAFPTRLAFLKGLHCLLRVEDDDAVYLSSSKGQADACADTAY